MGSIAASTSPRRRLGSRLRGASLRRRPLFAAGLQCRPNRAGVAQLVEHQLPKLRVVGSSPIARSSQVSANPLLSSGFSRSRAQLILRPSPLKPAVSGCSLTRTGADVREHALGVACPLLRGRRQLYAWRIEPLINLAYAEAVLLRAISRTVHARGERDADVKQRLPAVVAEVIDELCRDHGPRLRLHVRACRPICL